MDCVAGGTAANPLAGTITNFTYWLTQQTGRMVIPGNFGWVKCNKDFNGYYITDYGNALYQSFETVILNRPNVNLNDLIFILFKSERRF